MAPCLLVEVAVSLTYHPIYLPYFFPLSPCLHMLVYICLLCFCVTACFPHPPILYFAPNSFQVSECNWPSRQAPSLHNLFAVCKNMHNWLKQNPKNVCVITCSVRRCSSYTYHTLFSYLFIVGLTLCIAI